MKKSSSFHFLNLRLLSSDTLHFPLSNWYCKPRWVCHTGLIFFLEKKKKKKNSLLEICCYQPAKEGLFHGTMAAAFFCQSEFLTSLFMMDWTLKEGDYFGVLQSKSFQGYLVLNISFLDDSWAPRP